MKAETVDQRSFQSSSIGHDDLSIQNRSCIHTDGSVEIQYYDKPGRFLATALRERFCSGFVTHARNRLRRYLSAVSFQKSKGPARDCRGFGSFPGLEFRRSTPAVKLLCSLRHAPRPD
jgi:hypothetical protein